MTATVEFTGRDLAEAIAAAAGALNLPPEKLKFNVIEMGTKGFLGLGRRRARIAVEPDDPTLDLEPAEEPEISAPLRPAPANEPKASPKPRAPRPAAPEIPEPAPLTRAAAGETRVDNPDDETARLTRTVVEDILSRLGLTADLSLVRLGSRLVVNMDGPDRAILIGARGVTLEAMQLMVAKIVARKMPGEGDRLVLDVADYRFRRHSQVMENLKAQAEAALRTGQPQPLTGLTSAERRLVRLALRSYKDVEFKVWRGRESLVPAPTAVATVAAATPGPRPRRRKKQKGAAK